MYSIKIISSVISGKFLHEGKDDFIETLLYDSRQVQHAHSTLFFALKTVYNNGHDYLTDAYQKGVRNFIVDQEMNYSEFEECNIILVTNVLKALQTIASFHRNHFFLPVIGITGSNGKTVVKEWLYQILNHQFSIVRSPKSYNSQIGVPLSIWQINSHHNLGIFEAGISEPGEMIKLANIIKPDIGIITNIGEAHSAHFHSNQQKLDEKLQLFENSTLLIGQYDLLINARSSGTKFSWGTNEEAVLQITSIEKGINLTMIKGIYLNEAVHIEIPFCDDASIQNAINCWCLILFLKLDQQEIREGFMQLHQVDMRLQLIHGINGCLIINDSYSADITSLKIALDFLKQQSLGLKKSVIISEFFDTNQTDEDLYTEIAALLHKYDINRLVLIGERIINSIKSKLGKNIQVECFYSTDDYIKEFKSSLYYNEIVLIKGSRRFEFERVARLFEKKVHQTVLEINLNALEHNLKEYQKLLHPGTHVMAMVKAFSYGSGGAEIASILQFHHVSYLGVAYADEGVELVKAGIKIPIMVMNADETAFQSIVDFHLQPVIYSFDILQKFESYLNNQAISNFPVHIEIETGMNRLGFKLQEVDKLGYEIQKSNFFQIASVFTHLAASEDQAQDEFTKEQAAIFEKAVNIIKQFIHYPFLCHISNSSAIVRHSQYQYDMVRLGIGLYGIETEVEYKLDLIPVATLRTNIAQLKKIKKGESVSYNRKGLALRDSIIATVRIGYGDGFSRQLGNGKGKMWVRGKLVPVIGSVCMDMTMLDVTDVDGIDIGDAIIVFGKQLPIQQLAEWSQTIPYEIMVGISHRVKRVYFHE